MTHHLHRPGGLLSFIARLSGSLGLAAACVILAAGSSARAAAGPAPAAPATACRPVVAVYPSWKAQALPLAAIPWERFTHLALVFALPTAEGGLRTQELDELLPGLRAETRKHGRKLWVSIGGANGVGDAFQALGRDAGKRQKFVEQVRRFVDTQQLDGVDIDWEHWTRQHQLGQGGNDPVESAMLVQLLAELRAALPASVDLSASVVAGPWIGPQYLSELQKHVSYVALMSYDFTGAWSGSAVGHHADLETFKAATQDLLKRGFQREKILLGLPFYGKEFIQGRTQEVRDQPYRDILSRMGADLAPLAKGQLGHTYFETPALVKAKAEFARDQGFAGLMMFELSMDALQSPHSLSLASMRVISPTACGRRP